MKDTGTLLLKTDGGKRKMHYAIIDGEIYTTTDTNTNKVKQIKENNKVTIDLTNKEYIATLHTGTEEAEEMIKIYKQHLSGMAKLISKFVKTKNRTVIVLTEA